MSNSIPFGWEIKTLDEVATVFAGGTPSRSNPAYYDGSVPWVKSGEVNKRLIYRTEETISELAVKESSAKWAKRGSVLVAMYGATAGKVAKLMIDATLNQAVSAVNRKSEATDNDFLFYAIENNSRELLNTVQGSGQPNLSGQLIKSLNLPVPPFPEQQKIATILSSVDNVIEKTRAQIDKLKDLKTGMMQELLTKGVGHTEFKDSPVGRIPAAWEIARLGDIVLPKGIQTGPFGSQLHSHEYIEWGVPVIMPRDMKGNKIDPASVAYIPLEKAAELDKHRVEIGDLVFARRGDIGRFALVDKSNEGWVCGTGCLKVRLQPSVSPAFIASYLTLTPVIEWLNTNAVGQTMLNLNTSILSELPIILPPAHEQAVIGEAILSLDNKVALSSDKLDSLLRVKKALMQDLLTGKVRVEQKVSDKVG